MSPHWFPQSKTSEASKSKSEPQFTKQSKTADSAAGCVRTADALLHQVWMNCKL